MTAPYRVAPLPWPSDAELVLPGSKSEANRLLVLAAMSGSEVLVRGATPCDDVRRLVEGLQALGFLARYADEALGDVVVGPRGSSAPASGELFCGNAGTALRFLVSVAAITPGRWTITGDARMQRRPIGPLVAAWRQLGIDIEDSGGCPPVRVRGGPCRGGPVRLDARVSSQFLSSLLLVGGALRDGLDVAAADVASSDYVRLTCRMLQHFGVDTFTGRDRVLVRRGSGDAPRRIDVGGDWSAMGVWTCLEHVTGSRVRAANLEAASGQPDEQLAERLRFLEGDGERVVDVGRIPDQFLNLAVVATHRTGSTRLVGAGNLRVKECDRIAVMARELARVGAAVEELPDGLVVTGPSSLRPATVDPEGDHRVAIAFGLLGLLAPGIAVADPGCVSKSYPGFWNDLETVRRSLRCVAVVGMRGAGKSTFAAAFARATGCAHVDTDRRFEANAEPIAAFVAAHGWPAFRREEARLVAMSLAPGHIVSTGGGAVEHPATRALLRARALAIWLDAPEPVLRARVLADAAPRPSVTGAGTEQELQDLLRQRRPLYEEVAAVRVDATRSTAEQVDSALRELAAACRAPCR
jgi:3-phosphoshikimate 1-carboxyvinyltransferase